MWKMLQFNYYYYYYTVLHCSRKIGRGMLGCSRRGGPSAPNHITYRIKGLACPYFLQLSLYIPPSPSTSLIICNAAAESSTDAEDGTW